MKSSINFHASIYEIHFNHGDVVNEFERRQPSLEIVDMNQNNDGPSHVPWGIPLFNVAQLEAILLIFTRWRRSSKNECIHRMMNGCTKSVAILYYGRKTPELNNKLASRVMSGAMTSIPDFRSVIGMKSSADVCGAVFDQSRNFLHSDFR